MPAFHSFFTILFLIAALIAITAGTLFFIRFQTKLTGWAGVFSLAMALDLAFYYLVLTSATPASMQFWFRALVIIYLFLSITWLFFVILFTGHIRWISLRTIITAGAIPILLAGILLLTLTELDAVWMNTIGSVTGWTRAHGVFGFLFALYIFSIDFISVGLLIHMVSSNHPYFRNLALFLCAGTLMVIVAGFLELGGSNPFAPISIVQLFKIIHSIMAFVGVFIFRGGQVLPVARDAAFKHIQDGLLVLDRNDNLVDLNPAGIQIVGQAEEALIGKPISEVWKQGADLFAGQSNVSTIEGEHTLLINGLEQTFDVVISPVLDANRQGIGRVIVLRNVTRRERMEKALQEHTKELTRTNKLITALSMVASRLGAAVDSKLVLDTLGTEMRKLGLDCGVVSIDPAGEIATIRYVSYNPALLQVFEKIAGFTLVGYDIPKQYWPSDRLLKTKAPTWYSNPKALLRGLFAKVPEGIVIKARQLFGIQSIGQMCILPLISEEKVIGAMPVWGVDLQKEDSPILAVFASQVAGILQKARKYEEERQLNLSLARSKAFTSALSAIAAAFSQRQDKQRIFDILGMELAKLGLGYLIVRLSEDHQSASVENISTPSKILSAIQRFTGVNLKGYVIDRKYWGALAEEYFYHGRYLFSDNPIEFTSLVIPKISSGLLKKALEQSMGRIEQKAIYLPLINDEKAYGILGIWGVDLQEEDAPALSVFASQVAGILQNAIAHENETKRANDLARSNSMILALSEVAAHLDSSSDAAKIFNAVGEELKKLGLDSIVGILDESKQILQIEYISVRREAIHWAEKMTGHSLKELTIPRHLWPTEKVVAEKSTYWDPNLMKATLNMFPIIPESLHKAAMKIAGINLDDPVCYLPLANEYDVIGILAVWGAGLKQNDVPALSVLASQLATAIRNAHLYETEARRARELDILLKASEAASSSMDLDAILLRLASQLLELSGFESCYISEWDKESNLVYSRIDHSKVFWIKKKREAYSLSDYPRSKKVLLTGNPIILQGDFEAEEKQWMVELGRTAVIILAIYAQEKVIGLVEIAATKKNKLFSPEDLQKCEEIMRQAVDSLLEPLSTNDPEKLFAIQQALLQVCGGQVCSFSEWDRYGNRILTCAVFADQTWGVDEAPGLSPDKDTHWKLALQEGKSSAWVRSEQSEKIQTIEGESVLDVESMILFPLQKGEERIGLVELYDFNHKTQVSPEQLTLLRTIADKASYGIENTRLLRQTQKRLEEQTVLLHEKEVLLKEIHHRVKNNLQVISSLLNLQSSRVTDFQTIQILRDSQSRVRSMALIHEKLYQSQGLAKIDFGEYVKSLANDLFRSYRQSMSGIQLTVETDEVLLELDQAIPCGLILNELITNALKYAFPDGRDGTIKIELRTRLEHKVTLRVADDGVGMPSDFDILNARSLGLQLVNSLVTQLDGRLEIGNSQGTDFLVSFPC